MLFSVSRDQSVANIVIVNGFLILLLIFVKRVEIIGAFGKPVIIT